MLGLLLVMLGGIAQGAFIAPSRWIRNWAWENYWLLFSITSYLVMPWLLVWLTVPRIFEIYSRSSPGALAAAVGFGLAWGVGAIAFGLGVELLGMALGFAIILGAATTVGTLIPLFLLRSPRSSGLQMIWTVGALIVMLAGVVLCSFAGNWKEQGSAKQKNYKRGVLTCIASGTLSACGNLGLSFAGSITQKALELGVSPTAAPNAVWTLLTVPLFLCNAGYAVYLLTKNRTGANYRAPRQGRNMLLAISMGVLWMGGLSLYGSGARKLGQMGTSVGFAIFMSSTVLTATLVGILAGEWRDAPTPAKRKMSLGVGLLVAAIVCLAVNSR